MNKMIERFKNKKIAVHCKTQKEYDELMELLEEHNLKWGSGAKHLNYYEIYKEKTCIVFNFFKDGLLGYCYMEFYKNNGYKIVDYKDFIKTVKKEEKSATVELILTINGEGHFISFQNKEEAEFLHNNLFEPIKLKVEKSSNGNTTYYAHINNGKYKISLVQFEIIRKLNGILDALNEKKDKANDR